MNLEAVAWGGAFILGYAQATSLVEGVEASKRAVLDSLFGGRRELGEDHLCNWQNDYSQ